MRKRLLIATIIIVSALISALVFIHYDKPSIRKTEIAGPIGVPELELKTEYGLILDTLDMVKARIGKNEFLADILQKYNVPYAKIDELVRVSSPVFDVRKFRSGNNYSIIRTRDSLQTALYFVYEVNPVKYLVYALADSVTVRGGVKPVEVRISSSEGVIETSLWKSLVENETDPNLANELSEIFAWVIDFFGIQRGDSYKAIYEELYIGEERIGIGKVIAAQFNHMNEDYFAFYFVQDSVGDYFDEKAGSLRRTFLKAPLRFRRISSGFSYNRLHPILKIRRPHTGVDYAADHGTPVHAVGDGLVTMAAWSGGGGRTVKIRHNGTYSTAYLHLSGYGKGIRQGAKVKQGDVIGYVGSSGLSTGPHLDFRFYRNGQPIDPLKVESPPAEPVDSAYLQEFEQVKEVYLQRLQEISSIATKE